MDAVYKPLTIAVIVAALAPGAPAASSLQARKALGVSTIPAPKAAATTLSLRGAIDKYDAATRMLSLQTSEGVTAMVVSPSVRIRRGWRRLDASALEKLSGYGVTVRYSESGGTRVLESIHVFDKNERTRR